MKNVKVKMNLEKAFPTYELQEDIQIAGISIPSGFISNGASVPRIFWSLFPPVGKYFLAAVVHDYVLEDTRISWNEATNIFNKALKEVGVIKWKRYVMVRAVAFYGLIKRYK